jgi:hypothetical protein
MGTDSGSRSSYSAIMRFVCLSATISNPKDHMSKLLPIAALNARAVEYAKRLSKDGNNVSNDCNVWVVDRSCDGSPSPERVFLVMSSADKPGPPPFSLSALPTSDMGSLDSSTCGTNSMMTEPLLHGSSSCYNDPKNTQLIYNNCACCGRLPSSKKCSSKSNLQTTHDIVSNFNEFLDGYLARYHKSDLSRRCSSNDWAVDSTTLCDDSRDSFRYEFSISEGVALSPSRIRLAATNLSSADSGSHSEKVKSIRRLASFLKVITVR